MAETTGLVQQISVFDPTTCVWIGQTPSNSELLYVTNDGTAPDIAFAANLVQTLSAAAANYRAVAASHADDGAQITSLRIDPV